MFAGVRNLEEIVRLNCPAFGSKVSHLSKAMALRLPVLPGFCVTFEMEEDYVRQLRRFSSGIWRAYEELRSQSGHVPVIVRSSYELEDMEHLLFPGVFQSLHNIDGFDALLEAIGLCYHSVYTRRTEQYMELHHRALECHYFTVLVQPEQHPDYSGAASSFIPLHGQPDDGIALIQFTRGSNQAFARGVGPFNSYTVFQKSDSAIDYRRTREQVVLEPDMEYKILLQVYELVCASSTLFGADISIEWGFCHGRATIFQIRNIQFQPDRSNGQRDIAFFRGSEQGFKFQSMKYFHEHGLFPVHTLLFDRNTGMDPIRERIKALDGGGPVTVRFSYKNQIGLPRYFAKDQNDALRYLEENLRQDWAVILYNSICVLDSFELYLDARQMILEHVPGIWESDSKLYADAIYQNETQTDLWLAKDARMARLENEDGNVWLEVPPLDKSKADNLLEMVAPIAAGLRKDFADDLPLNFHFVSDGDHFYFLNCRLSTEIRNGTDMLERLHRVVSASDMEDWDGVSGILFEPNLTRGETTFLAEFIPFLKDAKVPVYVNFGILSHPAIMLREFGIEPRPVFSCHNHFVERKGAIL